MNHQEIRIKILTTLYTKYYSKILDRPQITQNILQETFPNETNYDFIYPELVYLSNEGLIHGEQPSGDRFPRWIRIEEFGIDIVEENNESLRKIHSERRLKILNYLYQKYFDGNFNELVGLDEIISNTKLGNSDSSELIMEFVYLGRKGLIDPLNQSGQKPVTMAKINNYGINQLESLVDYGIEMSETVFSESEIIEINPIKEEENRQSRTSKAIQLMDSIRPWAELILKYAPNFTSS